MAVAINGRKCRTVSASSTEKELTLDPKRQYTLQHTGLNDGGADTNTIYGSESSATVTLDMSDEDDKLAILSGGSYVIGPGIATYYIKSAAGTPVLNVMPSPHVLGHP